MRLGALLLGAFWFGVLALDHTSRLLRYQPPGIDFMPMWTAAREAVRRPSLVYDFVGLTELQTPLLAGFRGLRPFVYPPTTLLALLPLSVLPFWAAYGVWMGAGMAAVVASLRGRWTTERSLVMAGVLLSPPSMLVLATGQITFYVAALSLIALRMLEGRPWLAGVLLGFAGALKPQALVLIPMAFIFSGAWRPLLAAGLTALAAIAVSALVLGPHLWIEWFAALPRFERYVAHAGRLRVGMITPTALGETLGLAGPAFLAWRLGFAALAIMMAPYVFRATPDPARRLSALVGGALFVSPYAMHYDAALLAPGAGLMLLTRSRAGPWVRALVGAVALSYAAKPVWGAAAVTGYVLWASLTPERPLNQRPGQTALTAAC